MRGVFFVPDLYHLIASFVIYSILGWFVESVYMSICNKKITNRGFTFLPFCPIYGFGGTIGAIILTPLIDSVVLLYFVSAILATAFEFIVAKMMLSLFGKFWWDYTNKPLNYKGILCLESTLAWGIYGILIVKYLNQWIIKSIDYLQVPVGVRIIKIVLAIIFFDFVYHFLVAVGIDMEKQKENIREKYQNFKFRWW